jgi:hypothetical protein
MKKLTFYLICLCVLICSCSNNSLLYLEVERPNLPNLVHNPSFERHDNKSMNNPENWYVISSSTDLDEPVALDSTVYVSGKSSLKIIQCDKNIFILSDAFKVNYQGMFYARCYLKSSRAMRKATKIYFWAYDSAGNKKNSFQKSYKITTDWHKAALNAGFLKNSVNFARIAIFIPQDKGNTVWLDEAGCYMVHELTKE